MLGTMAAAALPLAVATSQADEAAAPPPPSRINLLVDLTVASHYLTPRGMDVSRQGMVFQPLMLAFFNVYKSDDFINSATVVAGMWNCFGTSLLPSSDSNGTKKTGWYETDPIAGLSFGLAKNFKLDVTYTAFSMQIFNIPFSQHLETKLSFNDSDYLKAFALHPYVIYWQELSGKAVASTDANPSTSYYFDVGIAPGYTFEKCGVKLEAPCRILMADSDFYGTGAGGTTFVSLYEFGVKASMPLKFMPQGYGHWSANIGFKRQGFDNPNLRATQGEAGATVVYGGVSTFF
ncbi:MAG: hypothetical protein PHY43_12565 [Verrucomicrobiales bacterium]|nr:hypothetical protein [Verrucomicrobiales bacterium]